LLKFSHYSSEVYRAKGRPKLSLLAQVLHMIVLIPTLLICVKYSFEVLYYARSLVRLQAIIVNFVIMYLIFNISAWQMMKNTLPALLSASLMGLFAIFLQQFSDSIQWSIISIIISGVFYILLITLFPTERRILFYLKQQIIKKIKNG